MTYCARCPSGALDCELNGAEVCARKLRYREIDGVRIWIASFHTQNLNLLQREVAIEETVIGGVRHHWVLFNNAGTWPGRDSADWIEYIPEG